MNSKEQHASQAWSPGRTVRAVCITEGANKEGGKGLRKREKGY